MKTYWIIVAILLPFIFWYLQQINTTEQAIAGTVVILFMLTGIYGILRMKLEED